MEMAQGKSRRIFGENLRGEMGMKQAVISKTNGKRASEYASSVNIVEKEELSWKKRILKLIWLLLNKGRRYQLVSLFMDIFACFGGILGGWALVVWGLGIKNNREIISLLYLSWSLDWFRRF